MLILWTITLFQSTVNFNGLLAAEIQARYPGQKYFINFKISLNVSFILEKILLNLDIIEDILIPQSQLYASNKVLV